uniref:Uncharacterized protein n=1 Tax=Timema douglasi TaxID=61478 RepID=A0A7R8Z9C9_TIMDO|nr:unnamed protein product [Timema douglasi]
MESDLDIEDNGDDTFSIYYTLIDVVISSDLDIDIEDNGDDTFSIYYTVKDAGDYTLSIKFGGQPVPDGFYTFTVPPYRLLPVQLVDLCGRGVLSDLTAAADDDDDDDDDHRRCCCYLRSASLDLISSPLDHREYLPFTPTPPSCYNLLSPPRSAGWPPCDAIFSSPPPSLIDIPPCI